MRRSLQAGARLVANATRPASQDATLPALQVALQQQRHMATAHETPLSKIMPPLVAFPGQVIRTALSLTGKLIVGTATSGPVKGLVGGFADNILLREQFVKVSELDLPFWTYWLSTAGYENQAAYKRFATAAVDSVPKLSPQQITDLVVGFHNVGVYDKALFSAISSNISANFTKFETEQLLKILTGFSTLGHYEETVYDDIADSITYANHYLAPIRAPVTEVAQALLAYSQYNHKRADLFVTLSRGISEMALSKLDAHSRKTAVMQALNAYKTLNFYPEQVDALLYFTETQPELFSSGELSLAESVKSAVESQTGQTLSVYRENEDEDAAHWYAHHLPHAPAHHELYSFREALVPQQYSPLAFRNAGK